MEKKMETTTLHRVLEGRYDYEYQPPAVELWRAWGCLGSEDSMHPGKLRRCISDPLGGCLSGSTRGLLVIQMFNFEWGLVP